MPQLIAGALIKAGVGVVAANIIGYGAYTAATFLALRALGPEDSGSAGRGLQANMREAAAPHDYVYGQIRKGGVITFIESTGTQNDYLHMVIALAGHEVEEIGDIYINDEVVTLDGSGFVTTSEWLDADGNKMIRIKKHTGSSSQTVDSYLDSETSVTSAFRGRGIAYIYVRLQYDNDVFANGIPTFTAVVKGKKVYDPRTSSTAYSANAALCIRDYITSSYGLGDSNVNDTFFSAAANTCDENVTLAAGGTEKRYEVNGVLSADETPKQVLDKMVTTCGGTLYWSGGQWKLRVAEYSSPIKSLGLGDVLGEITTRTRLNRRDSFNAVEGTFVNADDDWIAADYPKISSVTFQTEDNGVDNVLDFPLPLTTSASAVQRLSKVMLYRTREQIQFEADFNMNAYDLEVGDIIQFTNARYGWTNKEFEVRSWRFFADSDAGDLRVRMVLRETSSGAFDWNANESAIISNNSTLPNAIAGLTVSNLQAIDVTEYDIDKKIIDAVRLTWDSTSNAFTEFYEVQLRPDDGTSEWTTFGRVVDTSIRVSPLPYDGDYDFRVRAVTASGYKGSFATTSLTKANTIIIDEPAANKDITGAPVATSGPRQISLSLTAGDVITFNHSMTLSDHKWTSDSIVMRLACSNGGGTENTETWTNGSISNTYSYTAPSTTNYFFEWEVSTTLTDSRDRGSRVRGTVKYRIT